MLRDFFSAGETSGWESLRIDNNNADYQYGELEENKGLEGLPTGRGGWADKKAQAGPATDKQEVVRC